MYILKYANKMSNFNKGIAWAAFSYDIIIAKYL